MDGMMRAALDKLDILQVLATYSRGTDRVDLDLLRSVYWADSIDIHGNHFRGSGWDFVATLVSQMPRMFKATCHTLGQTWFGEMTETRATAETYFCSTHDPIDSSLARFSNYGRYIDLFEKRAGVWKILRRVGLFDIHGNPAHTPGGSRQSDGDASYELLAAI